MGAGDDVHKRRTQENGRSNSGFENAETMSKVVTTSLVTKDVSTGYVENLPIVNVLNPI